MPAQTERPVVSRFSTDDLPERDRVAATREYFGRQVIGIDIASLADAPYRARMTAWTMPGLRIFSADQSAMRMKRTGGLLADGRDGFNLVVNDLPVGTVGQRGREILVRRGDAHLWSEAEAAEGAYPTASRVLSILVPRMALQALVPNLDDAVARVVPARMGALRLLTRYATALQKEEEEMLPAPELRQLAVTHVYDLVALALGAGGDVAEAAAKRGGGLRAARLGAIKADIARNLAREDLSVGAVARRHGLTPRYVQTLFEGEGTTFSEFVLRQRVARAQRLLTHPRYAGLLISSIAYRVGFGDLSYFNRSFRRFCGATPSEVRQAGAPAA